MSAGVDDRRDLARSTATQTVLTGISRLTGFVRVVVVAAVLGTTFLGNTYQSANTVPNIVFELFAAGALQAVLVPALVARFDRGDDEGAERLAGSVLGLTLAVLGVLVVVGAAASPLLMRGLVSGVEDASIRADQVSLGTVFLLIFLPQILVYDVGLVATAVLHAKGRFGLPAFAPAVNNVVVCAAYGTFWWLRRDEGPGLDLDGLEIAVLAGGTSLGVVAFCALPIAGARRSGFRFRPNLDRSDPALRALARQGGWAALFLAMTQVLLGAVLVLGNPVEGGIVGYQVAFTFFLLPHALFALPVLNTLFPEAARRAQAGDLAGVARTVERGVRAIGFFVLPVAAALVALAGPLTSVALFGETGEAGAELVRLTLVGFAPGLIGYGLFYFLTRISYALDDTRSPALVHGGVVVAGVVAMVASTGAVEGDARIAALAWAHTGTYLVGAMLLAISVHRRLRPAPRVLRPMVVGSVASLVAGLAMAAVGDRVGGGGRVGAVLAVAAAGPVGLVLYVALQQALGGTRVTTVVQLLRPGAGRG
ncbi:MAG TPA: lipid II flippase MurJ [Acidimicrobiales bacterium]|nr:lipid II flippase MurJ [Acidimicrobiales bacterium]